MGPRCVDAVAAARPACDPLARSGDTGGATCYHRRVRYLPLVMQLVGVVVIVGALPPRAIVVGVGAAMVAVGSYLERQGAKARHPSEQ